MINIPSSTRSLVVIGVIAYSLFAIVSFPASLAIAWFAPDDIQASNVRGTAWSGRADTIATPSVILGETQWRARPLSLLTAKVSYHLNTAVSGGVVDTNVSMSPGGAIRLTELTGVLPISAIPTSVLPSGVRASLPAVTLEGQIGLDITELLIDDHWPIDATGTVDIVSLSVVAPVAETFGSYEVVFAGAGDAGLDGAISNVAGPLEVSGTLFLRSDKTWQVSGDIKPTSAASTQLVQGLAFLGSRNADGSYKLTYPAR